MTIELVKTDRLRAYPPRVTAFTRQFWEGLEAGLLRTTFCDSCAQPTFPPKPICPNCWSHDVHWEQIDPVGSLYSWTRIHAGPAAFEEELPYAVGVVDLAMGLRVACRLHGQDERAWHCEMPVRIVAIIAPDGPMFAAVAI
jgi:uncharacterized OB-fold protein